MLKQLGLVIMMNIILFRPRFCRCTGMVFYLIVIFLSIPGYGAQTSESDAANLAKSLIREMSGADDIHMEVNWITSKQYKLRHGRHAACAAPNRPNEYRLLFVN